MSDNFPSASITPALTSALVKTVLAAKGFAGHHKGWFTRTAETKARAIQALFAARNPKGKDINVAMRRVLEDLARDIQDLPDPTTWANIEICLALAVFFATPLHDEEPEAEHETRATVQFASLIEKCFDALPDAEILPATATSTSAGTTPPPHAAAAKTPSFIDTTQVNPPPPAPIAVNDMFAMFAMMQQRSDAMLQEIEANRRRDREDRERERQERDRREERTREHDREERERERREREKEREKDREEATRLREELRSQPVRGPANADAARGLDGFAAEDVRDIFSAFAGKEPGENMTLHAMLATIAGYEMNGAATDSDDDQDCKRSLVKKAAKMNRNIPANRRAQNAIGAERINAGDFSDFLRNEKRDLKTEGTFKFDDEDRVDELITQQG